MKHLGAALAALLLLGNVPQLAPRIDSTLAKHRFVGVVLVGRGPALTYVRNTGPASQGVDAVWRYASVTKQLTALIVMQEVAAGRLALDTPIKEYWPAWPQVFSDLVTIRMLLQHVSGLADPAEDAQDADGVPHFYRSAAVDPRQAAIGFCAEHPIAEPGTGYHYNNCDYIVLGALLEHITGKPFATLLKERIAAPLGLRTLDLFSFGAPVRPHVRPRAEPVVDLASYGAAGSGFGTPRELWSFDRALMDYRLLSPEATAEMWKGDPKLGFAALGGWSYSASLKGCATPIALFERRGEIGGVQIRNFLAPATKRAVIAFTARPIDFGQVLDGTGFAYDLLSAALCAKART
ncbi:MAG: beta-lactamase family protein [Sphingomonadaceae bacterium]|nr:beta-lactamase family protein [Sphingomonadaceae bacterium]